MRINSHLQTKLRNAADNLCLAITYVTLGLYSVADDSEKPAIETMTAAFIVNALDDETILEKDGYVKDAEKLLYSATGHKFSVTKRKIEKIQDLPLDKYSAVNYEWNGKNHWVGFYGQEMIYNSLEQSKCFSYGKPTDARIVEKQL